MPFHAVRQATPRDVAWIVALESRPDFASFIHRGSLEDHERNLRDRDKMYLIAADESDQPLAFTLLGRLTSAARSIELMRIVVAEPEAGIGKPFLRAVMDLVFGQLGANRLWLNVFEDNARARHAYLSVGFQQEGILREAALKSDGQLSSLVMMSILKSEYRP